MKTTAGKSELIVISKREIAGEDIESVDARDLHTKLDSKRQFGNWIEERIEKYGFTQGVDFITNLVKTNGRPKKDYILTLDTAKEIAMVENNEKGREIRRYFIEMEKQLRTQPQQLGEITHENFLDHAAQMLKYTGRLNQSYLQLREQFEHQTQEVKQLKAENNKHKALQTNISQLGQAEILKSVEEAGVVIGKSRNILFKLMRFKNFLKKDNSPYKKYSGTHFIQKTVKHLTSGGRMTSYKQTFITPEGLRLLKATFA